MPDADTIVALATAAGQAAVGVVRVSGPRTANVMSAMCGRKLRAREACLTRFLDDAGHTIDEGIAVYFAAPNSYTGEEVLELQAHGGSVVLQMPPHFGPRDWVDGCTQNCFTNFPCFVKT